MPRSSARGRNIVNILCPDDVDHALSSLSLLAHALQRHHVRASVVKGQPSLCRWIKLLLANDAIVTVAFGLGTRKVVYLALAALCGRPIVRWWVGSDVLQCLTDAKIRAEANLTNRITVQNIAVSPHLVTELAECHIKATFVPSIINSGINPGEAVQPGLPRRILVYLPTQKSKFYGEEIVRRAIEEFPDVEFVLVAFEDKARFSSYANVVTLGWIEDIHTLYQSVGCLLRITKHDGMPCMVIESLLLGRYVIYSFPLPGCWLAQNYLEVQEKINLFRTKTELNLTGMAAVKELLTPEPASRIAALVRAALHRSLLVQRFYASMIILRVIFQKLRTLFIGV